MEQDLEHCSQREWLFLLMRPESGSVQVPVDAPDAVKCVLSRGVFAGARRRQTGEDCTTGTEPVWSWPGADVSSQLHVAFQS